MKYCENGVVHQRLATCKGSDSPYEVLDHPVAPIRVLDFWRRVTRRELPNHFKRGVDPPLSLLSPFLQDFPTAAERPNEGTFLLPRDGVSVIQHDGAAAVGFFE